MSSPIPPLDPNASDSQRWAVLFQFMNEMKSDFSDLERRMEQKLDAIAAKREREAFDRGTTSGRVDALETQMAHERKDRADQIVSVKNDVSDQARKTEKFQFWLLTLTAGLVVQLVTLLLSILSKK